MRCLALDIGGTKIAAAIVKNGEIEQRQQIHTPRENVVEGMHQALAKLLVDYAGQFDYVAVASTGIINNGVLTALNPKNLGGLAAATYAEYQLQNPELVSNFAFITVSTGVGGGIVLSQSLQTGSHGIAGHIGHMLADPSGPMCGCGRRGCVEAIAAGRAIEAVSSKWENPCDPKEVFERFSKQDPQAVELVERSAKTIANLVADLVIGLDIQKIVIGGSVGLAEGYLPLVERFLQEVPAVYRCELEAAKFGQDAGLVGAAYWVKDVLLWKEPISHN